MFEKIAKQIARYFGNEAMSQMTEAELLNALEDMPTAADSQANSSAIEALTESMADFESRLAGITELSTQVETLQTALDEANGQISALQSQVATVITTTDANIAELAGTINTIKGTATTVVATAASDAPVPPAKPAATGEIKNDVIGKRLAGVKIGTFSNTRNNFQHN